MDQATTGTSLVSGIQDISAFLPVIGTEQCERHVGEALEGGFFYAAAAPLSIFGCLGIVKASAAILVASISPRFAQMLADTGFQLQGSVASLVGSKPGSNSNRNDSEGAKTNAKNGNLSAKKERIPQYIAALQLGDLLQEKHINKAQVQFKFDYRRWNWQLCLSTGLLSCLSIAPYVRLIMDDVPPARPFPVWVAPLARIAGSALSVVVAQMILQIQIQWILVMKLDGVKTAE
jgi:hypothetical protein